MRPVPVTVTCCPSISWSTGDTARVVTAGSAPPRSPGRAFAGTAVAVAPMSTHALIAMASLVRLAHPILAIASVSAPKTQANDSTIAGESPPSALSTMRTPPPARSYDGHEDQYLPALHGHVPDRRDHRGRKGGRGARRPRGSPVRGLHVPQGSSAAGGPRQPEAVATQPAAPAGRIARADFQRRGRGRDRRSAPRRRR